MLTIMLEIKARLHQIDINLTRKDKLYQARKLFRYLANHKSFMDQHKPFKDTVADKLLSFYHEGGYKEAKDWWKDIFGHEII